MLPRLRASQRQGQTSKNGLFVKTISTGKSESNTNISFWQVLSFTTPAPAIALYCNSWHRTATRYTPDWWGWPSISEHPSRLCERTGFRCGPASYNDTLQLVETGASYCHVKAIAIHLEAPANQVLPHLPDQPDPRPTRDNSRLFVSKLFSRATAGVK